MADEKHTPATPPPPPVPASDPKLVTGPPAADAHDAPSPQLANIGDDLFDINPLAALKLLGAGVEALVRITGDIPPSPPAGLVQQTNMRSLQAEKASIVRSNSEKSLARMREQAEGDDTRQHKKARESIDENTKPIRDGTPNSSRLPPTPPCAKPEQMEIDGVHLRTVSPNRSDPEKGSSKGLSPTAAATAAATATAATIAAAAAAALKQGIADAEPYIVIGANSQPLNVQHSAITRKFYSKKAPPIGISEYLLRLHRFCPMSTGVYLATSLYIYRLAVAEKAIAVTRRNAHRLLLAGLRVAMKALEDQSYSHAKVARVGGVSEAELARLEINFCFLAGFELSVCADEMRQHWVLMKNGQAVGALDPDGQATAAVVAAAVANQQREPSALKVTHRIKETEIEQVQA